jgi:signal transduction histidine kinase
MLRAVVLNLILNACQASGGQAVEIVTTTEARVCHVAILDRGPGIPPEARDRVFEAFYTTKRGGTGLGLAIVKRLIELQGGTVSLTPREGGGTSAIVTMPLA